MKILLPAILAAFALACASAPRVTPGIAEVDPHPSDETSERAVPIELGDLIQDRVGPSPADSNDWKAFVVNDRSRLRVRFVTDALDNALVLRIYKQRDNAEVGILSGQPGQEQVMVGNFSPGTYFIEINGEEELESIVYALTVERAQP